jgi:hypothetical protein
MNIYARIRILIEHQLSVKKGKQREEITWLTYNILQLYRATYLDIC